jgi:Carboxypeptidase regulatory-like domain
MIDNVTGRLTIALAALLLWTMHPAAIFSQVQTTTAISGLISDSSGAVVPEASVTLRNQDTGAVRQANANADGVYSFPSLLPGTYTITIAKPGFETAIVSNRAVQTAQPAHVDVVLRLGTTGQVVTVSAAGAELINTASAEITDLIPPTLVKDIPLARGNFFDLLQLTPQVVPQNITLAPTSFAAMSLNFVQAANTFTSSGIFAAGNRDSATNVSVDGSNVQTPVYQQSTQIQSRADVQEVRVETASMSAEFGSGVAAVNVITKSGTNRLHGELYEYFRNSHLDATPFFSNLEGSPNPPYVQNQYGAAMGGPIKKDKLFFFGNYEAFKVRQSSQLFETVPDLNLRAGIFTSATPIYNPYSANPATGLRTLFPNNQIPLGPTNLCSSRPTCVDSSTLAYLQKYVLEPNTTLNGIPMLTGLNRTIMDSNQATGRIDWLKSDKTTIYGRYTYNNIGSLATGLQPLEGTENGSASQNAIIHYTRVISANVVDDAMISYTRPFWQLSRPSDLPNASAVIGLANTSSFVGGPTWSVPGYNLGNATDYFWNGTDNTIQLKNDLSYNVGKHSFKFGAEATNRRFVFYDPANDKGSFSFADIYTQACPQGNVACNNAMQAQGLAAGGSAMADYLLGSFTNDLLILNPIPYVGHQTYVGFYAMDSWRLNSRLTLNYGLRYEYWSPWLVPSNTTDSFNYATGQVVYPLRNPLAYENKSDCYGSCASLTSGVPREGYRAGDKDFAPRIGLAYTITPNTVIRAGAGIYYDGNVNVNQLSEMQSGAAPFVVRESATNDISQPLPSYLVGNQFQPVSGQTPQPNATPPATFRFISSYMPTPTVYQWSASLQQRLGANWGLELDYIGSHTIHEFQFLDVNAPALPQGDLANVSLQDRRPYPQWGVLGTWAPIGWARYQGGTVSIKNNGWHGLTLTSNFTWAKNLVSSLMGQSDNGNTNFRTPYLWTGSAAITPQFWFIAGFSYQVPITPMASWHPAIRAVAGGWSISGRVTASSGSPEPVTTTDLTGTDLQGFAVPNRVCNPNAGPRTGTRLEWFNTSCFVNPAYGEWGNSTIGVVTDPGIANIDLSLARSFPIKFLPEGNSIAFRADFLNALNHTQWGPVDTGMTDATFGQITSTRPPRQIQLSLRYVF